MAIISISRDWGVDPSIVRITTTDSLVTITTAGYISTQESAIELLQNGQFEWLDTDLIAISYSDGKGIFTRDAVTDAFVDITGGGTGGGTIEVPTITNNIIVAKDNAGTIGNALTPSLAIFNGDIFGTRIASRLPPLTTALFLAHVNPGGNFNAVISNSAAMTISTTYTLPNAGVSTANFIVSEALVGQIIATGDLEVTTGNLGVGGSISSQTSLRAVSPTSSNGSVTVRAIDTGANFGPTIINKLMTQDTNYTIPDVGQAQGAFVVANDPFTFRANKNSGPGGGTTLNILDANCTTTSRITGSFNQTANPSSVLKIVPGVAQFDVFVNADPGLYDFSYIIVNEQGF